MPVLALATLLAFPLPSYPTGLPPFSPALGRPLAWDPYGLYALDAEGPLSKADAEILDQIRAGELGRAEVLCRNSIRANGEDVLPAWVLGQILRVRHTASPEYEHSVQGHIAEPASPAVLLYRFHVCRCVFNGTMGLPHTKPRLDRRQVVYAEMKTLYDLLRPYTDRYLGVAIAVTQISPSYALTNRAVLESYRRAHPKGVDVRPLLCQAYNGGIRVVKRINLADGTPAHGKDPDEPQPKRSLEIAITILKDRANDSLGHFYAGRSYARMALAKTARQEMRAALDAGGLPPQYEASARQYVETGSEDAFLLKPVVY